MQRESPGAIVFDLDGVLIDSERLGRESMRQICARHEIPSPQGFWRKVSGLRSADVFAQLIERSKAARGLNAEALAAEHRSNYLALARCKLQPCDGALEILPILKTRFGLKMGLATSSSPVTQQFAFEKFGFGAFFSVVVTAADVTKGKPDPECYQLAAARLGVETRAVVVIEDSEAGVAAAKAAQCTVVGVVNAARQSKLWDAGADEVIETLHDLPLVLKISKIFNSRAVRPTVSS